jgi:hypothetical protein
MVPRFKGVCAVVERGEARAGENETEVDHALIKSLDDRPADPLAGRWSQPTRPGHQVRPR